jgi:hypothetical protein
MAGARLSTGWQLRHEGVKLATVEGTIEGTWGRGEVVGFGEPRHVGVVPSHRDAVAEIATRCIKTRPPQEGGVNQRRARRVELRHEGVTVAVEGGVEGAWGGGLGRLRGGKQGDGLRFPRAVGSAVRHRTGLRGIWDALCGAG